MLRPVIAVLSLVDYHWFSIQIGSPENMKPMIADALQFAFEKSTPGGKWNTTMIVVLAAGCAAWLLLKRRGK